MESGIGVINLMVVVSYASFLLCVACLSGTLGWWWWKRRRGVRSRLVLWGMVSTGVWLVVGSACFTLAVVGESMIIEPVGGVSVESQRSYSVDNVVESRSAGGASNVNDAAYDAVFFKDYGTNPFVDAEDDNLSTFGMDVDTGSYAVMRYYVDEGVLPPPESVRVEEYVNYFDYGYGLPGEEGVFLIDLEGGPSPFGSERHSMLRVGLQAGSVEDSDRAAVFLVLCIDVSGSMREGGRLGLVKAVVEELLDALDSRDSVGVVAYGDSARVVVEPVPADGRGVRLVRNEVGSLRASGSTYVSSGLDASYRMAGSAGERGQVAHVVLMSDGVANVGPTGPESVLESVRSEGERGVHLSTMGFGMGNYNDVLMEQLANRGDGSYYYIDSTSEAERLLSRGIVGLLEVMAKDARVQVEFNPEVVRSYRLLGYENRDVEDERFRDDEVDAGEVMAGQNVTALYEMKLYPDVEGNVALVRVRYEDVDGVVHEVVSGIERSEFKQGVPDLSLGFRLAVGVAEYAEVLGESYWARVSELRDVAQWLEGVGEEYEGEASVAEVVSLVEQAVRLRE